MKGLTPIQRKLRSDRDHRIILVSAGRRSRKTLIGKSKLRDWALRTPGGRFFHGAPTWKQAESIFWQQMLNDYGPVLAEEPSYSDKSIKLLNGAYICITGLDKPERVEGQPWDGFHITEFPNCKPGSWDAHLRPLLADAPREGAPFRWCILDGVPDAHSGMADEYYSMAKKACGGSIPDTVPLEGAYGENGDMAFYSWWSSDVLSSTEIQILQESMDPLMFDQEMKGSFVTLRGLVYYGYSPLTYPEGNLDDTVHYDPTLPVYIGGDFNVDPMTAVCSHHIVARDGLNLGRIETHVYKGYFIRNSNTRELYSRIAAEHLNSPYFVLTPCQSSSARQTVAEIGETDRTIIEDVFRKAGKTIHINPVTKNPLIKDRVNLTNARLHHRLIRVNNADKGVKELISDWATIPWREGSTDMDLGKMPLRGHISAGLDYCEYYHFDLQSMMREVTGKVTSTGGIF